MRETTYSSREFSEITGATLRQLQWWDECGYLPAEMVPGSGASGKVRQYSKGQIVKAKKLRTLSSRGAGSARLRALLSLDFKDVLFLKKPRMFGKTLVIPRPDMEGSRCKV